jgi:hypothetical protein
MKVALKVNGARLKDMIGDDHIIIGKTKAFILDNSIYEVIVEVETTEKKEKKDVKKK